MSSQIPTRRATRATRLPDENAVKGRQPAARGAAGAAAPAAAAAGSSKPAAPAALDALAQNKRKREALGELTNNTKHKNIPRGAAKDGRPAKPHVLITRPVPRAHTLVPVRRTRASAAAAAAAAAAAESGAPDAAAAPEQDDDAMAVDEPAAAQPLQQAVQRRATRATATTTAALARRSTLTRRVGATTTTHRSNAAAGGVADDAEGRAAKRRCTSSEADEEDVVEVEVEIDAQPADDGPGPADEPAPEAQAEDDEEVTGWDDLDKDDFDDPMMVSEYVVDIFKYLSDCEKQTLPNPDYIQHQGELHWSHRTLLMDFLIGLHQRFRLCQETLYLAVNLIDRFLSMRVVSLVKLQLVGLAGLFIASKFEEIVAPSALHYLKAAAMEDEISEADMLKAERYILKTLNWSVSLYPQPMNWLRRISKADDYDPHVRTVAKFFLEIHVLERRLLAVKPSLLAAASIWLARLVLDHTDWTPNLAHYSGYGEKKIIPVANVMLNYCLRTERHEHFQQKFASRRFSKASVFVNEWVAKRWELGDKIVLASELPYIKTLALARTAEGSP